MSTLAFGMATLATVTGIAVAAGSKVPGINGVTSADIAKNAVKKQEIAKNAVKASELANNSVDRGSLLQNAVTAPKLAPDSVTAPKLAPNSVTPEAVEDITYTPLPLVNGWSNAGGYYPAGYTVDAEGQVRLRGAILGGASGHFATLPVAVRPQFILQTSVYAACPKADPTEPTSRFINAEGLYIEGPTHPTDPGEMSFSSTDCGIYSLDGVTFEP
jgi:hypothetical protein